MARISIPFTGREDILAAMVNPRVTEDAKKRRRPVWPITKDVPTALVLLLDDDGLHKVICAYPQGIIGTNVYPFRHGKDFVSVCEERGIVHSFGPSSASGRYAPDPAYDETLDLLDLAVECFRWQSDEQPFKWMNIFSAEIICEEWRRAGPYLRHLIADTRNPFR